MQAQAVLDVLSNYYAYALEAERGMGERDLRLRYDQDVAYYRSLTDSEGKRLHADAEALHADVIISFWLPFKQLLKLEAGYKASKSSSRKLEELIGLLKDESGSPLSRDVQAVAANMSEFAKLCYTPANYLLLPKGARMMNVQRYRFFQDRLDSTLYECFEGGRLAHYFNGDEALITWINEQKLNPAFRGASKRENIRWFNRGETVKKFTSMNAPEIYEYLDNTVTFIKVRDNLLKG